MRERRAGDVTRLLDDIREGHAYATEELLPLVYAELRRLARRRLAGEWSRDVPETTSLVHEAYLRLVGNEEVQWECRAHFFGAAGEAMRRILIDRARRRGRLRQGGGKQPVTLAESGVIGEAPILEDLLALDRALTRLEQQDSAMSTVVKLRYFAGLSVEETAEALNLSKRTINRQWRSARAWLLDEMTAGST